MSNENKSIHEFDFNLICEYFSSVERQGPGSPEVTLKALDFIENLSVQSRIADLGCGTGTQTITLARHTPDKLWVWIYFPILSVFSSRIFKTRSPRPGERNSWLYGQSPIRKRRVRFDMVGRSYLQYRFSAWTAYMEGISEKRRLCCRFRSFLVHQQTSCGN